MSLQVVLCKARRADKALAGRVHRRIKSIEDRKARRADTALAGCRKAPAAITAQDAQPRRGDTLSAPHISGIILDLVCVD